MKVPEKLTGYLIGIIFIGVAIYLTLDKLGLAPKPLTKEDKEFQDIIQQNILSVAKAPNMIRDYKWLDHESWHTAPKSVLITDEDAMDYATKLHKALDSYWIIFPWTYGDDEDKIYAIFTELPNKYNVSQVADQYLKLYGDSLKEQLLSDLDNEELFRVYEILKDKQ